MIKQKLVVIGNGMAGARVVEEILKRSPNQFNITLFGAEPYGNYNRILLSNILNGQDKATDIFINPIAWYEENNITLHTGVKVIQIDRENKRVLGVPLTSKECPYALHSPLKNDRTVVVENYDKIIIATGSRPFVPPMEGFGGKGTFLFRTLDDCARIAEYAAHCKKAAVIGGGLLGLEAARGLLSHGVQVTIVEAGPHLMANQLDEESGKILCSTMEAMGMTVLCSAITKKIETTNGKPVRILLHDGLTLSTDMVVVSTGIRPIVELANSAGLAVGRGILVNDQMRTTDRDIFSVGECIEHRGQIYGLVDPIWEQARTLADVITGTNLQATYTGSKLGTKLKVMGVALTSMGQVNPSQPEDEIVLYREPKRGIYQKLVIRNDILLGAILLGNTDASDLLLKVFKEGSQLPKNRTDLLFVASDTASLTDVTELPDHAQICNCNGVSKGQIRDAILTQNCTSVSQVGQCTKAGKGCGSCKGMIASLIQAYAGKVGYDASEHYYVPGVPLEKSQLILAIQSKGLKSVSTVFRELAIDGKEDAASKVGLASLLRSIWNKEYDDERDSRFINDRVHANIQKDGTFSIVPRIYGGVTSADELIRIGRVAKKFNVPMVKITGGQRIDLLGVQKEDLPQMWKELGTHSGHAYTKAVRTVKSCVGIDFCRFGLGGSIKLAQELEYLFQGIETPHKVKLAVAGCPRNCSEAYVKDIGVVAIEGGNWEIYIGGAAGSSVRKGDLLATVKTHGEVFKLTGRFIQYYRDHAKYMERTYGFVERIGVDRLKAILIKDELGVCMRLDEEIQKTIEAYSDPWEKESNQPAFPHQFEGPELIRILQEEMTHG